MNNLSKNMDTFFNNLIETMPNKSYGVNNANNVNKFYNKNTSSNFYKEYVEHNLLLLFLLTILIIIIITYFYWNNDIKKTIEKNNIIEKVPIEKENIDFIDNIDKETLLGIIDELSSVNEKQYEIQQKLKKKQEYFDNIKSQINDNSGGFDNYQNIKDNNIINIDGVYVQSPYK
jgi:hypothetical protein